MELWETFAVAVGLSMDAAAVALGASASQRARGGGAAFRLAFHFGLFQMLMPVVGWLVGISIARHIAAFDHWVAFGLLLLVGGRMVRGGGGHAPTHYACDPSRGLTLVLLSVATSIDALAVGLSLAMLGSGIWFPAVVIGLVTGGLSALAVLVGHRLGQLVGQRLEVAGGLLLILIGLSILADHL